MTRTVQPRSLVFVNELDHNMKNKPAPKLEDNLCLLLSICDSLDNLCENLNRLKFAIQGKNIEQILYKTGETR